ncbi:exodeoxyribonuclease V subunit alpha [Janibacter endophyticus]|uniref:exodeoxyribonuclease V subunit alpha n=1 Tax=Janibacter endophyticus TaxID=2806261 RepID=UPI0027DD1173|nr:exodeoxyribonuclease V subunit alpha [Janibacter endophyticus]
MSTHDPTLVTFTPFVPTGPRDRRLALHATGILAEANAAGWIEAPDVHVTGRLAALVGGDPDTVLLAVALAVRAAREGSSCLDPAATLDGLRRTAEVTPDDPGHDPDRLAELVGSLPATAQEWLRDVVASACAAAGTVTVEHDLVYLDRYHREEALVAQALADRSALPPLAVDTDRLEAGLLRVFDGDTWEEQKAAVRETAPRRTTILVGGPGTGKTSTVAGLLALLVEQSEGVGRAPSIALAAPTGKAAARLRESVLDAVSRFNDEDRARVGDVEAVTLHRLLGWRRDSSTRFQRDRTNPLPHDIVVVDEASMLSLTMTARLLDALRPTARLVLVGDPDQLASVEAGAVLADLVAGYSDHEDTPVSRLLTSRRFGTRIGALAAAVRDGHADEVMAILRSEPERDPGSGTLDESVEFLAVDDPIEAQEKLQRLLLGRAERLRDLALAGDVPAVLQALDEHRLLCAHRDGPWGVSSWNARVERWLSEQSGFFGRQYAGRPLLVTANDYRLGLSNGDTGVVVLGQEGRLVAAFGAPGAAVTYGASTVADAETAHAMTIHKSQGSQAEHVTVLLPDAESRLLTRELLYTGLTRAKQRVTIVGSEESVRAAVERRTARASGLRHRL